MTDPLPPDVREYLDRMANGFGPALTKAGDLLAKYPKPQPEPQWQPGDVILCDGIACLRTATQWLSDSGCRVEPDMTDYEPLFIGGRRVHPARFHDHAHFLRGITTWLGAEHPDRPGVIDRLAAIADDMDPEVTQ